MAGEGTNYNIAPVEAVGHPSILHRRRVAYDAISNNQRYPGQNPTCYPTAASGNAAGNLYLNVGGQVASGAANDTVDVSAIGVGLTAGNGQVGLDSSGFGISVSGQACTEVSSFSTTLGGVSAFGISGTTIAWADDVAGPGVLATVVITSVHGGTTLPNAYGVQVAT